MNFNIFPPEIHVLIFSFLSYTENRIQFRQVSKQFSQLFPKEIEIQLIDLINLSICQFIEILEFYKRLRKPDFIDEFVYTFLINRKTTIDFQITESIRLLFFDFALPKTKEFLTYNFSSLKFETGTTPSHMIYFRLTNNNSFQFSDIKFACCKHKNLHYIKNKVLPIDFLLKQDLKFLFGFLFLFPENVATFMKNTKLPKHNFNETFQWFTNLDVVEYILFFLTENSIFLDFCKSNKEFSFHFHQLLILYFRTHKQTFKDKKIIHGGEIYLNFMKTIKL